MSLFALRLPQARGEEAGYVCCGLGGHWTRTTMGIARALPELSTPEALAELVGRAGQAAPWGPGQPLAEAAWRDAGWGGGWLSARRWESDSVKAFEARFVVAPGHSESTEPWTSGGFAWCDDHGCWMSTVFTYVGGAERGQPAKFGLHPAALTVWGWDRDPIAEGPHALDVSDLLRMGATMGRKGAAALALGVESMSGGMHGSSESTFKALREISARAEEREIERAAGPGRDAMGQGQPRL